MGRAAIGPSSIPDPDEASLGPAMLACNASQRRYVIAIIEVPGISRTKAAIRAGYSNVAGGAKVRAFEVAHNPVVQAAIREEAGKRLSSSSLAAAGILEALMQDKRVKPADRIKAAGMLLDRSGFGAAQTINVNKTVTDRSGTAVMARLKELASKHGIDPMKLLSDETAVVEAEFTEVTE
jgi:hypothetical protein